MNSINDMNSLNEGTGGLLATEDDATQMPLGVGGDPAFGVDMDDSMSTGESKSKTPLLMALVLLIAGGTLYGMRMNGVDEADSKALDAAEQKIDAALLRLTGKNVSANDPLVGKNLDALFSDTENVVAMFGGNSVKQQVEIDNVKKNPFELVLVQKSKDGTNTKAMQAINKVRQKRMKELRKELTALKLQTVMHGKTPMAIIDGKVVREGEDIGSFTITQIAPAGVRLTAEGNIYTLSMKKPQQN